MSSVWGRNIKLSLFGESHGAAVGMVLDGLPAGLSIDENKIAREMKRRAPGQSDITTARREADSVRFVSGILNALTIGSPICAIIENTDARSADYASMPFRPGHADFPAFVKHKGKNDMRGGGHFSGRLTAGIVCAGAIAKQVLARLNIEVAARIFQIYNIYDENLDDERELLAIAAKDFAVKNDAIGRQMRDMIVKMKGHGDSMGGAIECAAFGARVGVGEPFFDGVESVIASMMFSIPAVKGVEIGKGFELSSMRGSEANDALGVVNGGILPLTNSNGGINGGLANGAPIVLRVAIKPTPSISQEQQTVNAAGKPVTLALKGRHDPCIVPRCVPVVEAALALCMLDLHYQYLEELC